MFMTMKEHKDKGAKVEKGAKWAFRKRYKGAFRFFAAFFITLTFAGSLTFFFFWCLLPALENHEGAQAAAVSEVSNPSDSFNMLLIFYDGQGIPLQLMLLRLDAVNDCFDVMPVPLGLEAEENGVGLTLSDELAQDGASDAIASLEASSGIKIDFRCVIQSEDLPALIELFGGFNYDVPENLTCSQPESGETVTISSGNNFIDGTKAQAIMSLPGRYDLQAGMMKAFVTQKFAGYYLGNSGGFFKDVFNLVTTDFSMDDLLTRLDSVKMVSENHNFVTALTPSVTGVSQDGVEMSSFDRNTLALIKKYFGAA
jgi:hypothetical protein